VAKMDDTLADLYLASRGSQHRQPAWKYEPLRTNVRGLKRSRHELARFQIGFLHRLRNMVHDQTLLFRKNWGLPYPPPSPHPPTHPPETQFRRISAPTKGIAARMEIQFYTSTLDGGTSTKMGSIDMLRNKPKDSKYSKNQK